MAYQVDLMNVLKQEKHQTEPDYDNEIVIAVNKKKNSAGSCFKNVKVFSKYLKFIWIFLKSC